MVNFQLENKQAWNLVLAIRSGHRAALREDPENARRLEEVFKNLLGGQWKLREMMQLDMESAEDPAKRVEFERKLEKWFSQDSPRGN